MNNGWRFGYAQAPVREYRVGAIDPCDWCGLSTAPGFGRWVNRVPGVRSDGSEYWICAECLDEPHD